MSSENPESTDLDLKSSQQAQLLPQIISIIKMRKKSSAGIKGQPDPIFSSRFE